MSRIMQATAQKAPLICIALIKVLYKCSNDNYKSMRAKCLFSFSQECSLLSGSLALEALLIGVHSFCGTI